MTSDEVRKEERLEIDTRLYRAQCHFEDLRNEQLHTKAKMLGEKFGGMQEHVTRYDLNEAEAFLTRHGFGRDASARSATVTDEWGDDWTSIDDALPTIPDGHQSVKVSVKLALGEAALDAYYLRHVGLLSCPGPGFALEVPITDINGRVIGTGTSSPVAPTHWRPRDA
ncbi:hypothetical protein [Burkholderia multivorans]|uniref:hypothetical protein n=1 Tax=Burkholderiaceae TaxID=119060 RepID=UPI000AA69FD9|nr:hypothetical protein [Burkholderia multivorans]MDR9229596.1 hypothetical protein [Burkholderia multivorans]HDR9473277.1 hypothetical protein [Burkholderia multivorans]